MVFYPENVEEENKQIIAYKDHPSFESHYRSQYPHWFTEKKASKTKGGPIEDSSSPNKVPAIQDSTVSSSSDLKRKNETVIDEASSSKQLITDGTLGTDVDMKLSGTAGGQGAGEPGMGGGGHIYETGSFRKISPLEQHFHSTQYATSFGLGYTFLKIATVAPIENQVYRITHLASLPVDKLWFYMTSTQYSSLPANTRVKKLKVTCKQIQGPRQAFEVNSTESGIATLNQFKIMEHAIGLNLNGWGTDRQIKSFEPLQPMIAKSIDLPLSYPQTLWGYDNSSADFGKGECVQMGRFYKLPNYYTLVTSTALSGGTPFWRGAITREDASGSANKVITYEYEPEDGLITAPHKHLRTSLPAFGTAAFPVTVNVNQNFVKRQVVSFSGTGSTNTLIGQNSTVSIDAFPGNNSIDSLFTYEQPIEKSQILTRGIWNGQAKGGRVQPSFHVGVVPIPSLTTTTVGGQIPDTWTDIQMFWEITTDLWVESTQENIYPYATAPQYPIGSAPLQYSGAITTNACTIAGLLPNQAIRAPAVAP